MKIYKTELLGRLNMQQQKKR